MLYDSLNSARAQARRSSLSRGVRQRPSRQPCRPGKAARLRTSSILCGPWLSASSMATNSRRRSLRRAGSAERRHSRARRSRPGSRHRPKRAMPPSRSSKVSTIGGDAIPRSDISHQSTTSAGITRCRSIPTRTSLPSCSRPSRTCPSGGRKMRPSLTAAARDRRTIRGSGRKNGSARGRTKECHESRGQDAVRSDSLIPSSHLSTKPGQVQSPADKLPERQVQRSCNHAPSSSQRGRQLKGER